MLEDGFGALIDLAICPEYQIARETTSKPTIMDHRDNRSFISTQRMLEAFGAC